MNIIIVRNKKINEGIGDKRRHLRCKEVFLGTSFEGIKRRGSSNWFREEILQPDIVKHGKRIGVKLKYIHTNIQGGSGNCRKRNHLDSDYDSYVKTIAIFSLFFLSLSIRPVSIGVDSDHRFSFYDLDVNAFIYARWLRVLLT